MQSKINFIVIFFLASASFADSFKYNSTNNHGVIGLINTPSARFLNESSMAFTAYRGDPERKIVLTLMPYDWLEGSVFYTSIKDKPYPGFNQDYKDKGFNIKFRLKKEDDLPAVAIGFNDIGGTGFSSSEYIVSSYGAGRFDFSLGFGWGVLSGGNYNLSNPLKYLSDEFSSRDTDLGRGGDFRLKDFFSGKKIGVFGGIVYKYSENVLFNYEYDSSTLSSDLGFPNYDSNHSFSLEYLSNKNFTTAFSFERGSYFGMRFGWKINPKDTPQYPYKNYLKNNYSNSYNKLQDLLALNNIGLMRIDKLEEGFHIEVQEYAYKDAKNLQTNIESSLNDSGFDIEKTIVTYSTAGLNIYDSNISNLNKKALDTNVYIKEQAQFFSYTPRFSIRPFLAGREDFLKVAFLAELDTQYIFSDNFFWSSNLKYPLWQNFNDLYYPPVDTYPQQVRSDIKKYLNNFDKLFIGRSQLDYFKTIKENHHIQISAGIFEEMFSGYGFEYLWNRNDKPYAFGIEIFEVYKRDYDLMFGLTGYKNTTGFFNAYYENDYLVPFSIKLSIGEYLAGDRGYTFDISRKFRNGTKMGGFFTLTNVSKEQFGEGSFDKGIYFSIPISDDWLEFFWRPLTKDPGAKLIRKNDLYELISKHKIP